MGFVEKLNEYIQAAGCTQGDLSRESGISSATISRYRNASRMPDPYGPQIPALAGALAKLSADAATPLDEDAVARDLVAAAGGGPEVENTSQLLDVLGVSNASLARALPFDASFLSRVRNGKSRPTDAETYVGGALRYIANHCDSPDERRVVAALIGSDAAQLEDARAYLAAMRAWVGVVHAGQTDPTEVFLSTLDAFNLDDYLREVHFDEMKLPPTLPQVPTAKTYQGLAELRQGELDFFRSLVTSRNASTLFMCGDMPMEDMAEDAEFAKKWMIGVAATLKRGVHLSMIHNVDRPYREMMLGLEGWIPLYMTGLVSPYYLPGRRDEHYMHVLYSSESVVLMGEGITGHHDQARYYVSRRKDDIAYGKSRAGQLLSQARPLMEIYRAENAAEYLAFVASESKPENPCRRMLPTPPLFTLPKGILDAMLARTDIASADAERIRTFADSQRRAIEDYLLRGGTLADTVADMSHDEFIAHPAYMMLPDIFFPKSLQYTSEEYQAHVRATEEYAKAHDGYTFATDPDFPFRNIRITLNEGSAATISKGDNPPIHFVIRHPTLRAALENMVIAVAE